MKINSILPSGIVRNTSNTASKDGQMEELINLRSKNGSLKSIAPMVSVPGLYANEYQNIYIHNNSAYKHLLGVKNNMLYYFADMNNNDVVYMLNSEKVQEIVSVKETATMSQIGNICVFIDDEGMKYVYWTAEGGEARYKVITTNYNGDLFSDITYPDGRIDLRATARMDDVYPSDGNKKGIIATHYETEVSGFLGGVPDAEGKKENVKALITSARNEEKKLGRIHGFVMVCTAIELYDGSYVLHSRPVLLNQAVDNRIRFGGVALSDWEDWDDKFKVDRHSIHLDHFRHSSHVIETINNPNEGIKRRIETRKVVSPEPNKGEFVWSIHNGNPGPLGSSGFNNTFNYILSDNKWIGRTSAVFGDGYIKNASNLIPNFSCYASPVGSPDRTVLRLITYSNKIQFRVNNKIDDNFKGIVKSVNVFMTSEVFGQNYDNVVFFGNPNNESAVIRYKTTYFPQKKEDNIIVSEIEKLRHFYLIKSMTLSEYNNLALSEWIDIDLEKDKILVNLTAQKELPIDAYSRNTLYPKCSMLYNGKLHVGNYAEQKFKGFPVEYFSTRQYRDETQNPNVALPPSLTDSFTSHLYGDELPTTVIRYIKKTEDGNDNDGLSMLLFRTTIVSENFQKSYVWRAKEFKTMTGVDTFWSRYRNLNPMLSYPDINAQSIDVYLYTYDVVKSDWVELYAKEFVLKQGALNYAYYLSPNLKPIDIFDLAKFNEYVNGTSTTVGLPSTEDVNSEDFKNKIKVSAINNPLVFPVESTYTIGNGGLIGFASNTKALSTGQAGAAPLYIFSSDGVYALFVDSSGQLTYTNSRAIARDVCNNAKSITPIDNGVVFTSAVGVMILVGGDVTNISEFVKGRYDDFTNISSMDYLKEVAYAFSSGYFAGIKETKEEFLKYIENADIGYNHKENELWITNPDSLYSYLYKSGMWTKATQKGKRYVFDYPNCYLMQDNGTMLVLGKEEGFQSVAFLTRPIKLDSQGFKQGYRAIIRTLLETTKMTKSIVFGRLYSKNIYANPLLHDSQWRLPSESDVDDLHSFTNRSGGVYTQGGKLKSTSSDYWYPSNENAENLFGFDARGGGVSYSGGFFYKTNEGCFWLSGINRYLRFVNFAGSSSILQESSPNTLYSIRFCRDLTTSELSLDNGTQLSDYVDFEGNKYVVRKIYNRAWMCENLMTEYLFNGEKIASSDSRAYENNTNNVYVNSVTNYNSAIAVYGSYDAKKWAYIGGTSTIFPSRDLGTLIERVDCKYFKIFFASTISEDSYIDYIDIASDNKLLRQKIR